MAEVVVVVVVVVMVVVLVLVVVVVMKVEVVVCFQCVPVLECTTPESTVSLIRSYWFSRDPSSATTTDSAAPLVHT